jgi:hypothetical protein
VIPFNLFKRSCTSLVEIELIFFFNNFKLKDFVIDIADITSYVNRNKMRHKNMPNLQFFLNFNYSN